MYTRARSVYIRPAASGRCCSVSKKMTDRKQDSRIVSREVSEETVRIYLKNITMKCSSSLGQDYFSNVTTVGGVKECFQVNGLVLDYFFLIPDVFFSTKFLPRNKF